MVERLVFSTNSKILDAKIGSVMKRPDLGVSRVVQRKYQTNPEVVLDYVHHKISDLQRETQFLKRLSTTDIMAPLAKLSRVLGDNQEVELVGHEYDQGQVLAKFKTKAQRAYDQLLEKARELNLKELKVTEDPHDLMITFEFRD